MNPGDFLVRLRVLLASDLLTATDRPVNAIATAVGYASESAFGRAFRLATGSTPTQFADRPRKKPTTTPAWWGSHLSMSNGQLTT